MLRHLGELLSTTSASDQTSFLLSSGAVLEDQRERALQCFTWLLLSVLNLTQQLLYRKPVEEGSNGVVWEKVRWSSELQEGAEIDSKRQNKHLRDPCAEKWTNPFGGVKEKSAGFGSSE